MINKIKELILTEFNNLQANKLIEKYLHDKNTTYLSYYSKEQIVLDLKIISKLSSEDPCLISIFEHNDNWHIKLFKLNSQISLSDSLPIMENFGIKLIEELPFKLLDSVDIIYIYDFLIVLPEYSIELIKKNKTFLVDLGNIIINTLNDKNENDSLNKLALYSNLNLREINLLRAITYYLLQTSLPFSMPYLSRCLCKYSNITDLFIKLFTYKFDYNNHDKKKIIQINEDIVNGLMQVSSIDEDRILKSYLTVLEAIVRTNFYQIDSNNNVKPYISFKLESSKINFLPKPLPLYEIFVYSQRFEAIHLRGGKISRGGLRWSDRIEDYRTEVLGLAKAQMVKNSIIVPTGAKGGFVCKKLPDTSNLDSYLKEGIECYSQFISALLEITDNIENGVVIPPKDVIRYDNDDPYLVVAADKGTATFSDYANNLSLQYKFWLGDAFASGGSHGYDHKKIGITAKGAWESAKRHFRHLDINIQEQDFTVIGIGDMSGDVFGNAMLLSEHIKLIAAFNHQHIFIDPDPNSVVSYKERKRLFSLTRSSWSDYKKELISQGGGVFSRNIKSIPLSKEIKELLQTSKDEMNPNELINAILKLNVDMLYNGGIGTYIKASSENHESVKDKANDSLRVNANELNVKVVVEGGNLGVTQLARVEFASKGGLIYTDAIDNSAGVDCSDHEVNIKILFTSIMHQTKMNLDTRNALLSEMTANVADLVIKDNYLQTEILEYAKARSIEYLPINANFILKLEKQGLLDRKVEFLPNIDEIEERKNRGQGFTLPELSVLLAYSKMTLNKEILNSDLVNNEVFNELLLNYFPQELQTKYKDFILTHYLKKEIIANQLANLIVNKMGITFITRFEDEFRINLTTIVLAFWIVYKLINAEEFFKQVELLDNKISASIQVDMHIRFKKAIERMTRWLLRNFKDDAAIIGIINEYSLEMTKAIGLLNEIIPSEQYLNCESYEKYFLEKKVPKDLAIFVSRYNYIPQLLDIAIFAKQNNRDIKVLATNYFYLGKTLCIDELRKSLIYLPEHNKWQALSRSALLADCYSLYTKMVNCAIKKTDINDDNFANSWMQKEANRINQIYSLFDEIHNYKTLDLAILTGVIKELERILQ